MILFRRLLSIVRLFVKPTSTERELDDELRLFVEMSAAARERDEGLAPEEARRQAMLELGGIEQVKERVRTERHGAWLDETARDIRYAFRMFARNRGFTAVILMTLALGIGANTAIFGLVDALMLRLLPVRDPQQLVRVSFEAPGPELPLSYRIARALADRRDIFEAAGGFSVMDVQVGAPGDATRLTAAFVTGDYFETLGLDPSAGRLLTRVDDEPGAPLVGVVSNSYWRHQLEGSPSVVGRNLTVNGRSVTIVGATPRGFTGTSVGSSVDLTLAAAAVAQVSPKDASLLGPGNFWLRVLARPAAGLSPSTAAARLNAVWPHIAEPLLAPHWPASRRKEFATFRFRLTPGGTGWTYLREVYQKPLLVLTAAVGVLLLIACANVASLLLARAAHRHAEIAVRLAIGASRGRIVRQLLIESLVLSLAGATLGMALAWASGRSLVGLIATGPMPVTFDLTPNWHVLTFTAIVAIVTGVLFGMAPAVQTTASGPLREGTRISRSRSRLLRSLVSVQVALSLVLLAGAGLFVRTLQNLERLDPGFRTEGVLVADLESRKPSDMQPLIAGVRRLPGVLSASLSTHTPLSGSFWSDPAVPAGQPVPERDNALFVGALPGFFSTIGIRLLSGRDFTERDATGSPAVAIVNEVYAQRHFGSQNPVGRHLSASVSGHRQDLEIIGVAANTNGAGLRVAPPPTIYVAYAQLIGEAPTTLVVRARGGLGALASDIQRTVRSRPGDAPIEVRALSQQVGATLVQERLVATLAGGFALLALALAAVGLYGSLAYTVAQRRKEIGIRLALGAQRTTVVRAVFKDAARLTFIGIAIGLPAAWAASRAVQAMLFGITAADPFTIAVTLLVLIAAAHLAAWLPARSAARMDPLVALRSE
jgi:predicted permease